MNIRMVEGSLTPPDTMTGVATVSGTAYVNAQIRAEQYDVLMEKLDLILRQQAFIMDHLGIQPDGTPTGNR